jgi:hypothetical protein
MIKSDSIFITRVMKHINGDLKDNVELTRISESLSSGDVHKFLSAYQLLKQYVIEKHDEFVFRRIQNLLVETDKIPYKVNEYDLTKASEFYRAMEDEIIREMVSGAAIGGRMSGLGSNSQVNSTGMAGIEAPVGNTKNKKKIKILSRKLSYLYV